MNGTVVIALTGGPGGGKSALIRELLDDPSWMYRLAALPEAISLLRGIHLSPRERPFQRVMVGLQFAMEDGLLRALGKECPPLILCERGSLDPLAYWLDRGWAEDDFFVETKTTFQQHYMRYAAVIHLVTAADYAEQAYRRFPDAARRESPEAALRLDRLLGKVWGGHPAYHHINNAGMDWQAKAQQAKLVLEKCLLSESKA